MKTQKNHIYEAPICSKRSIEFLAEGSSTHLKANVLSGTTHISTCGAWTLDHLLTSMQYRRTYSMAISVQMVQLSGQYRNLHNQVLAPVSIP